MHILDKTHLHEWQEISVLQQHSSPFCLLVVDLMTDSMELTICSHSCISERT